MAYIVGVVGCYTLDLYCCVDNPKHGFQEFPHQYTDELGSRCRAIARKAGWRLFSNGMALCPKCKDVPAL